MKVTGVVEFIQLLRPEVYQGEVRFQQKKIARISRAILYEYGCILRLFANANALVDHFVVNVQTDRVDTACQVRNINVVFLS